MQAQQEATRQREGEEQSKEKEGRWRIERAKKIKFPQAMRGVSEYVQNEKGGTMNSR